MRPGIAFRGHVYQPTEMALVMNGGTVSTTETHTFCILINLIHLMINNMSIVIVQLVCFCLVDAHSPN